jgi:hypothetical protein
MDREGILYLVDVPCNTRVFLTEPPAPAWTVKEVAADPPNGLANPAGSPHGARNAGSPTTRLAGYGRCGMAVLPQSGW